MWAEHSEAVERTLSIEKVGHGMKRHVCLLACKISLWTALAPVDKHYNDVAEI